MNTFLIAILISLSFSFSTHAQVIRRLYSPEKIVNIRKNAVIKIAIYDDGELISLGTGFFINSKGLAVTNFHIFYNAGEGETSNSAYAHSPIPMNRILQSIRYKYHFTDFKGKSLGIPSVVGCGNKNNIDACLLQFKTAKKRPYIPITEQRIGTGHKVFSIGYCGGKLSTKKGKIVEYHNDFLAKYDFEKYYYNKSTKMIDVSNELCPGDSGGPIFSSLGHLVGMTTVRFDLPKRIFYLGILIKELEKIEKVKPFGI